MKYLLYGMLIILAVFVFRIGMRSDNMKAILSQHSALQNLDKRIPVNTRYILLEEDQCPNGYDEVKYAGDGMDILIPAGTLVVGNGGSGAKKYHLCSKKGERQTLLPPVKE